MDLEKALVELYRKAACKLPIDVLEALKKASEKEDGAAKKLLKAILKNCRIAQEKSRPICQDTGIPIFRVFSGEYSRTIVMEKIISATREATKQVPLRKNAIDLEGKSKSIGKQFPEISFEESSKTRIDLILKGGGSENLARIYKLPNESLRAERDFEGVKKCVLDSVVKAQGKGCPPYSISVGIGGSSEVLHLAKKQFYRKIGEHSDNDKLAGLEKELLEEINGLGIGPLGVGGKTTAIDLKAAASARHPASYFVGVSFMCWAYRRWKLRFKRGKALYG